MPNPSFEEYSSCPSLVGQIARAEPWVSVNSGDTPDYFHVCATNPIVAVPYNHWGYQEPHTGEAYAGLVVQYSAPLTYREYIIAPLLEPLEASTVYSVGLWLNLTDENCGSDQIGVYLSAVPPVPWFAGMIRLEPQLKNTGGLMLDSVNWTLLSGCFVPEGGEQFITIGNFTGLEYTNLDPNCPTFPFGPSSYYLIDDVFLYKGGTPDVFDFDLGDPVMACNSYLIDPGIPNVSYLWSDGSKDSTLLVTESGMYYLTITSGCTQGFDSIAVYIHGQHPVDLGPEEVNICEGDTFVISLNPHFSEYIWLDGSTDAEYIITTTGFYRVTMNDGCATNSDQIQVNVIPPPPDLSLSDQTILCPNEQIEFNFDPNIGDFMWQNGSTSSYYSITEPGFYALTISNMCGEESGSVDVIGLFFPHVDLGPDSLDFCEGQAYEIVLNPEMTFYDWQDNSFSNEYTITTTGLYSVTATNECGQDVDTIAVFFHSDPVFDFGEDTILCPGQPLLQLDPGAFWNATYLWQDSSMLQEYEITTSGTYHLLIINICGSYADTITVDFNTGLPMLDLGPDLTLCAGEQVELSPNITGVHFMWQDSSIADSFLISGAGWHSVTISDACSSTSDSIYVILQYNPPQLNLPSEVDLCLGDSIILDAGMTGSSYLWSDGSTSSSLLVSAEGVYSVTVSNTCGVDVDTVPVLDAGLPPTISLGENIEICPGDIVILTPQSTDVTSWLWSDGSEASVFSITASGIISVVASNACGVAFDTISAFELPPAPTVSLGPDTAICPGSFVTLSVDASQGAILWSDGSTDQQLEVFQPGQYAVTISNQCGTALDSIIVTLLPDVPAFDLGADQAICPGETITIAPGIPNVNYLWQDGSVASTYSTTQADTIILTLSNTCGVARDTLLLYESTEGPNVDLGPDVMACVGESVVLQANISGVDYLWQDGSTNSSFTTTQSGVFILTVSNNCGTDTDTLLVDISGIAPSSNLGADTTLCSGASLWLTADSQMGTSIQWQDGSSAPTYVVNASGTYILTESNICGVHVDSIQVDFLEAPLSFDLGMDTILCPGEFIVLYAPITPNEIRWQDGSTDIFLLADQSQTYSLRVSNTCGFAYDEINVVIDANQPLLPSDTAYAWCQNEKIMVDITQSFTANYIWSTGSEDPILTIVSPGLYEVTIFTDCYSWQHQFNFVISSDCHDKVPYYIPNVFSPNGDGINDIFSIQFASEVEIISLHGTIFDRWGNLVFESQSIPFEWNGNFKNNISHPGVYCYQIRLTYLDQFIEKAEVIVGDILLMR